MIFNNVFKKYFAYLCILCAIIFFSGCARTDSNKAEQLVSVNLIDQDGLSVTVSNKERLKQYKNVDFLKNQPYQKVLQVYGRDCNGDIPAYITSYYPNGQPKQYLEVVNNRAFGRYNEWHSNGTLKLEVWIVGGAADINTASEKTWLFDGKSRAWDEDGNLAAEIEYSKGELEGPSLYYHCNGAIWKQVNFCKNKMEGTFYIYESNGELLSSIEYDNGIKNGTAFRYWPCNILAAEELFCKGNLIKGVYFDKEGVPISQIESGTGYRAIFGKNYVNELQEYHDGFLDGEVKVLGQDGRILKIYKMKYNLKSGEEIEFFDKGCLNPNPKPKFSIMWYEGKIHGLVKTWYDNGNQASQREMANNAKNGHATGWYKDGSLMLIEEYESDKLMKGEYFRKGDKIPVTQILDGRGTATIFDPEGNFLRKVAYFHSKPIN